MNRLWIFLGLLITLSIPAAAQTGALEGFCDQGGVSSVTSGLNSTNKLQGDIPSCTITVYLTGTTTLATLYSDKNNTPLANPFTANALGSVFPGHWLFFANDEVAYDVIGSGGIAPNTYPAPVPLCTDCFPSTQLTLQMNLQHNSSATNIDQNLYNVCDNGSCGPTLNAGFQQVVAKTGTNDGSWVFETAALTNNFQTLITGLPTTAQSTTLYPGTMTTTNCNPGDAGAICTSATGVGAYFMMSCCTGFQSGNHPNITATNYALPASIPAANVTTVYNCIQGFATNSGGFWDTQPLLVNQTIIAQKTYCDGGTSGSGYDYATASVSLSHDGVGSPTGFAYFVPFLLVVYTGTPITNNFVQIAPPLTYSGTTIGLMTGMPAPPIWDTGSANAYVGVTTSITTVATGQPLILAAGHANTGASTLQLNTVTNNIVKASSSGQVALAAGDIITNAPAFLLKQEDGTWLLTDPQTGGSGGGTTTNALTMNNSGSGAASGTTFNGSAAETISYNTIGAAPALTACSDESSTFTPSSGNCYFVTASVSTVTPAASAFVLFTITTSSAGSMALTGTTIADGGSCSSYISGTTLTLTASQSVTVLSDGTNIRAKCTAAGGGGGSLPTATAAGQIIASTAAGTTYAAQPADVYWNSGDTVSSINANTLCATACVYHMTGTVNVTATASLNAAVTVVASGGGNFNVSSAQTLTVNGKFSAPDFKQHFTGAGSVLFTANTPVDYAEWFGAAGNGSTDDTVAIQAAINAEGGNQSGSDGWGNTVLLAKTYLANTQLNISSGGFNLLGINACQLSNGTGCASSIKTSSASITQLSILGGTPQSNWMANNAVKHILFNRTTQATGTATGISIQNTFRTTIDDVGVNDSIRDLYIANIGAGGTGAINNFQGYYTGTSACGSGPYYGVYVDETSTNVTPSLRIRNSSVGTSSACSNINGFYATGVSIQDLHLTHFETALITGIVLNSTSPGSINNSDNHFDYSILDGCPAQCIKVSGMTTGGKSSVNFSGGEARSNSSTSPTVEIDSSNGVLIHGMQIAIHNSAVDGVYVNGGAGNAINSNTFEDMSANGTAIHLNSTTDNTVVGNTIAGNNASMTGIKLTAATRTAISADNLWGTMAIGVSLDSTSNDNDLYNLNQIDPTSITTPYSNLGTGNVIGVGGVTWPASGDAVLSNGTNTPAGLAPVNGDCVIGSGGSWTAGSCGSGSFFYSPLAAPPSTSSFTNVNFQTGTTVTAVGSPNTLFMVIPNISTLNWQIANYTGTMPSTPWIAEGLLSCFENTTGTAYISSGDCGLYAYDGTKLVGAEFLYQVSVPGELRMEHITNVTTDSSTIYGTNPLIEMNDGNQSGKYVGLCYDGTNLFLETSMDGQSWWNIHEDTSGFITPTSVAFGGVMDSSSTSQEKISLKGFSVNHIASCP